MRSPNSSSAAAEPTEVLAKALTQRGIDGTTADKYLREWRIVETEAFGGAAWPPPRDARAKMTAYVRKLVTDGLAPSTIRRRLQVANRFFEAMGRPRVLKGVRGPAAPGLTGLPTLSNGEIDAIFAKLEHPNARDAFQLSLLTGLKISEILTLRYGIDDLRAQRIAVKRGKSTRVVALGRAARDILRRRLFGHAKWHRKVQWYSDVFRAAADQAGLPHAKPLMVRNTFAVRALAAGLPLPFVMNNLGVRSETMSHALIAAYLEYEP